ncbi:PAS domain S-box protein [Ktedonobacter racemifer]|uniref:histidine kinase n=1 Tax=Ktedonobacter racemifer DSM 44963 TaxID=485913 RepID=D6TVX6_KTERA|nr:PAS domain S-box protein [Ktedonobacter racemifer]EFH84359.1 PAS/PAC sensor signal transduction histidine kinase [Ktedonobacter racemifer DSM 44963]
MHSEHPLFQEDSNTWIHGLTTSSRLSALTQEMFDVFWILTPAGGMQAISSSWQTLPDQQDFAYPGRGWLDAVHPMDRQQGEDALHEAIDSGHTSELVCHIRSDDNSYHLVHLRFIPVREASGTINEVLACGNNLTRQMQTEQMSEAQVQLALKASGVGMWDWNLLTDELIWTDQKRALFGLSPEIPISDERFLETLHPDDRERTHQRNMQAIAEKKEYNKDYRTIWPDGSVHWLTDRAQVICDETGKPTRVVGATLDITELKHKEEELQEAKDEVTTILESITDAFLCLDSQWRYSYLNQRMETYLGKKREEVLGKEMWKVVPMLLGTIFEDRYRTAMATQQATHFEAFHPAFQRWVETYVYPQPDGLSIYFHDISERKQIEEALRESEARFRLLMESNIIGIITTDRNGNILEANAAFLSLLGYTQEDLATGQMKWDIITTPQTRARDTETIEEALRTGVAQPYEIEYLTKSGKRVPALIGRALFRREGSPPLFLCFVLDQTYRKEAEKQKDLFLGITGHELRTPLAALRGTLQLIERRLRRFINKTDNLTPEMVSFFEGIQKNLANGVRQVDVQTRLINDLLDVSRITSGTLKLSLQRCDLVPIIRETVEDLRLVTPERQLLLELPEDTPVNVLVDQNRISQVITNYVTNAIRYSSSDQPVHIGLAVQENMARVWVRDHGPGLSKEAQEKVWRCFHQVKEVPVQSGSEKGLGLGLYICQILIEQHHGEVDVESTPGKGSTFWFSLPLTNENE